MGYHAGAWEPVNGRMTISGNYFTDVNRERQMWKLHSNAKSPLPGTMEAGFLYICNQYQA
jgi:hypothetical protein